MELFAFSRSYSFPCTLCLPAFEVMATAPMSSPESRLASFTVRRVHLTMRFVDLSSAACIIWVLGYVFLRFLQHPRGIWFAYMGFLSLRVL